MTTIAFDPYLVDTLMPDLVGHDRQPSAFLVYLFLWRQTQAGGKATAQVALRDIADATGLSKRAVQDAIGWLAKRQLLTVARERITAVPVYTVLQPWRDRRYIGTVELSGETTRKTTDTGPTRISSPSANRAGRESRSPRR